MKNPVLNRRLDRFTRRVKDKFGDWVIVTGDYQNYETALSVECKKHGEFFVSPVNLMAREIPCLECRREIVFPPKECEKCGSTHDTFTRKNKMTLCRTHHEQWLKDGSFRDRNILDCNKIKIIEDYAEMLLYNGRGETVGKVKIDIEDIERVQQHKWHINDNDQKYVTSESFEERTVRLHRFLMDCPKDKIVDHIDRDIFNCRKSNLRICSRTENNWNAGVRRDSGTGIRGVYFDKTSGKYKAHIQVNKKRINLGTFSGIDEAIKIRRKAEKTHYGDYAPDWGEGND